MDENHAVTALSPMRKVIATRMSEANRTIPHFRASVDIAVDTLLDLRRELRDVDPETHVSLNDLLIKCCATALMDTPEVNIQWVEGQIHQYRTVDISIVTAIDGGLATPIVRRAQSKSVWEIAHEVKSLTARAAKNALKMDEVFGGTFSISNLGMYGVDEFDAVINPPQCAILAVGAAKSRVLATQEREIRVATVLRVTLSVDHRALDGVAAAKFLSALRKRVEQPRHLLPSEEKHS